MSRHSPQNYPHTLTSPVSGRPMVRGEKQVTFQIEEQRYGYPYASGEGRLVRGAVDDRDCAYGQPYAQSPA